MEKIISLLESVAEQHHLLFIMHPPTEKQLARHGYMQRLNMNNAIELRKRYSYFDFLSILEHAEFIIADGGSLQEETSYLGVPCLLFRNATEREEGLDENVVLSNFDDEIINNFLTNYKQYRRPLKSPSSSPTEIIISEIKQYA